jgi:hypothetical protein
MKLKQGLAGLVLAAAVAVTGCTPLINEKYSTIMDNESIEYDIFLSQWSSIKTTFTVTKSDGRKITYRDLKGSDGIIEQVEVAVPQWEVSLPSWENNDFFIINMKGKLKSVIYDSSTPVGKEILAIAQKQYTEYIDKISEKRMADYSRIIKEYYGKHDTQKANQLSEALRSIDAKVDN